GSSTEEEFGKMRELIKDYPSVAMRTEAIATPLGHFKSKEDFNYYRESCNVNMPMVMQMGCALVNDEDELPPSGDVWQFNVESSLAEDMFSQEIYSDRTVEGTKYVVTRTAGISGSQNVCLLSISGVIVDGRINRIVFPAGFGFLFRTITRKELPRE
ncbi:hypothetical protein PENTCL1PPCAC_20765, partial [Pristionchus entomophagus]